MAARTLEERAWKEAEKYMDDFTSVEENRGFYEAALKRLAAKESSRSSKKPTPNTLSPFAPLDGPRVILTRGDHVQPEPVDWLWDGWIAAGKMALIGGAPGCGKTTIAGALAATVTVGGRWPDGSRAKVGSVAIWSGEDGIEDTLSPRMMAAGADMSRVHFITGTREHGVRYPFDPSTDMEPLADALRELQDVRLLVVDPIVSATSGDSHKNAEVRRGLQPLVDLAAELRCGLVGITHFTKGTQGRDPVERITGSLAFGALARLVMVAAKGGTDGAGPERLLVRAKSNIGPDGGGYGYAIEHGHLVPQHPGIVTSRVLWGGTVQGTARELLAGVEQADTPAPARDAACEWLADLLADGPVPSAEVWKAASDSGLARGTVRAAKDKMGVKAVKPGGRGTPWEWVLPEQAQESKESKGAKNLTVGPFEKSPDSLSSAPCARCAGEGCDWCD